MTSYRAHMVVVPFQISAGQLKSELAGPPPEMVSP
jgi:hypothetical protein